MEGVAYSGITEATTLLLLHRKGVDNLTNTKLHAKFNELAGNYPCTRIELSLEVAPTVLEPLSELLSRICSLQGVRRLARDYYVNSTTPLQVELLACTNGITTEQLTGTPAHNDGGSHVIRLASNSSPSPSSFTGICLSLQLPMDSTCAWVCAKTVATYFHLLCVANTKVTFMVSYHGNGHHKMVEYQSKDHMTINIQGHTLMTTLHPHYCQDPSLSNRKNKLHAVRGKRQMISGIRTRSGDTVTLQLSVACAAVPGLPSLARGKKLPADRLCRAINVTVYGPGGVPVFPPSSNSSLLLSQVVNWEDYGVAVGNQCSTERTSDNFDQTLIPSFSNELIITKDSTRVSMVERNCVLHVFLFIEAAVESADVSSMDSASRQLRSLQMLQHNLEEIQLSHLKQFRTAFHTSLNKLLCNYNSFSKVTRPCTWSYPRLVSTIAQINSTLEEAIPSVSEAVASIISHSRAESFQHSCCSLMEVEPTGEEIQQWLMDRLWRIASHKLGARYHNGQLIRAAEEPDTPDIAAVATAAPSHRPSLPPHHSDDTLATDLEDESVVSVSRRCYHPSVTSSHHNYISQTDSVSSELDCVMAESFASLGSEDLEWSDTDHTTSDDITDDELWSDDNTLVNDGTLWDDNDVTIDNTNTIPVASTTSVMDTLTCSSASDDRLLQSEAVIPANDNITTNEMPEDTESTNEITASNVSPDGSLVANGNSNNVIPIKAPSILTYTEALAITPDDLTSTEDETQDDLTSVQALDNNAQAIVLLSRERSPDNVNTCFDELADFPSSPEPEESQSTSCSNPSPALPTSNTMDYTGYSDSTSIMDDQCLIDQISAVCSAEVDDDCVAEGFDWN